jgi:hypothetical protein
MTRWVLFLFLCGLSNIISAKEWKSLKAYQIETHNKALTPSDWLRRDRTHNSLIWQQANTYNLLHNLPQEYTRIRERRDFYEWLYNTLKINGHKVVWVEMAHFISKKMRLLESFPCALFSNKKIVHYANEGSKAVFNNVFKDLKKLFSSETILMGENARQWDETIAYKEQYKWLDSLYETIDASCLKTIEYIAKGKCIYGLVVSKSIRFKGEISSPKARYIYAITSLRNYCINKYK